MTALLPPTRHRDIVWQAGDDTPAVLPVPGEDGELVDVTGWGAVVVVVCDGVEVHRWSTDDDSAETGPDGVTLLADDSEDWTWHRGRFELRVTAPDGTRRVPARGDMLVRALQSCAVRPVPPVPSVPPGVLVMRHGDSWRPRPEPPSSPRFALHQGGEPLALAQWWVRAEARMDEAARPLFSWTAHLSAREGTGVEMDTVRYRRRNPLDPTKPLVVELPAMWLRLDVEDWIGKPKQWEGYLEVELTRGTLTAPLERLTITGDGRPLIVVPDRLT